MSTRNISNYPHTRFQILNPLSGKIDTFYAVPTRLEFNRDKGVLVVEVFVNNDFNNFGASLGHHNRHLPISGEVMESYSALFDMIRAGGMSFLEAGKDFELEQMQIDLQSLKVSLTARHREKENRIISDKTTTPEEFEQLKTDFPQIVQAFAGFALDYMATNDQFAKFE